jgi:hypothetical protein
MTKTQTTNTDEFPPEEGGAGSMRPSAVRA